VKKLNCLLLFALLTSLFMLTGCNQPASPKSARVNPEDAEAIGVFNLQLAGNYLTKKEFPKAIACFQIAAANLEDPKALAKCHLALALAYQETGQLEKAMTNYTKVVKLGESNIIDQEMLFYAHAGRLYYYQEKGQAEKTWEEFAKMKEIDPQAAEEIRDRSSPYSESKMINGVDSRILAIRKVIDQKRDEDGTGGQLSDHLTKFFNSVNTLEEALSKALNEENFMAMSLLENFLSEAEKLNPTVLPAALKYIEDHCDDIGEPVSGGYYIGKAMYMVTLVGPPALPEVKKRYAANPDNFCWKKLMEEIH